DASWFVYNLPWQILEVVLSGWERNKCVAQYLKKSLVSAIGLETELALLQANPLLLQTAGDYNFTSRLTTVQQHLVNSSALATLAAGATPNVDSEGNQDVQVIDDNFARFAYDISLISQWPKDKPDAAEKGYGIFIDAEGSGFDKRDGSLWL